MKFLLLSLITIYQKMLSPVLKQLSGTHAHCRYYPTCSMYAKRAIAEEGALHGSILTLKRIARCQPFSKAPAVESY